MLTDHSGQLAISFFSFMSPERLPSGGQLVSQNFHNTWKIDIPRQHNAALPYSQRKNHHRFRIPSKETKMAQGSTATTNQISPLNPPRHGSPFQALPSDILHYLFTYLFAHKSTPITVAPFETHATLSDYDEEYYSSGGRLCAEPSPRSAQLLAVCQRFAAEGAPVLYGDNTLELRGARRVAQLLHEDWWAVHGRYMLREVVLSDCVSYRGVGKQVVNLFGLQLERIVVAPDAVVLRGLALLELGLREMREEALLEAARVYSLVRGRDLVDDVVALMDFAGPWTEVVLRVAVKLEYRGGNIAPPCIFEYEMLDLEDLVEQDDDFEF